MIALVMLTADLESFCNVLNLLNVCETINEVELVRFVRFVSCELITKIQNVFLSLFLK